MDSNRVFCTNCKKRLHNVYEYKGNRRVELVNRRCKGKFLEQTADKRQGKVVDCECRCQTHYLYRGFPVRIGEDPPERAKFKDYIIKPISDEMQQTLDEWKALKEPEKKEEEE